MPPRFIQVTTGSRLHIGMFAFNAPATRAFGGVGFMLDRPRVRVRLGVHHELAVTGPAANRVNEIAQRVQQAGWMPAGAGCAIEVLDLPRQHVGLGTGTQLAMAIAAGINQLFDGPPRIGQELALAAGRGVRSAIGLHGFSLGGMLVEAGRFPNASISPLISHCAIAPAWRWVLLAPPEQQGLSGATERQAFEQLPAVPEATTARLCQIALLELVPAAVEADHARFARAVADFGRLAGQTFATQQSGVFATPQHEQLVADLAGWGHVGVAQSSWGPTLAVTVPDQAAADQLVGKTRQSDRWRHWETVVAQPLNQAATVEIA